MTKLLVRAFLLAIVLSSGLVQAQIAVSLRLPKRDFISGEPVIADVTITNHSGRPIEFQGFLGKPWLDFVVINQRSEPVAPTGAGVFGKWTLPAGQSSTRGVSLTAMFQLATPGNYQVSATVRMPGVEGPVTVSNRLFFNVAPGRPFWSQKVGAGRSGKVREYRVLNFSGGAKSELYVQVLDDRTGVPFTTFSLGEILLVRKPSVTVDSNQRLHVLHLAGPTHWVHSVIDTDGRIVSRNIHRRTGTGDPYLTTSDKGAVTVGNSLPVDLKAEAARRAKTRKLSERPSITY
jgi:hypothetical protein